jgi:ABC-type multidrug transport system fused ATPase/permease subunit
MKQEIPYSFWQLIRDIAHTINPYNTTFWWGIFLRATSDITALYPAWAISQIVLLLTKREVDSINTLLLILLGWAGVIIYFSIAHGYSKYLGYQVAEQAGRDLYKRCLAHILRLDFSWQEKENSGNKMKRMDRGYEGINQIIRRIFDVLIEVIVNTVGIVFIFFTLQQTISYALIFFIVTYFLLGTYLLKKAVRQEAIVNKKEEDMSGLTFEALNNIQTIKSLSISQGIIHTITNQLTILVGEVKKRIYYFRVQDGILTLYEGLFEVVIVCFLIWGILHGQTQISLLVLFLGLFQKVGESTRELTSVTQDVILGKIWISRAMQILHTEPVIEHPGKKELAYPQGWQELKINHVAFSYEKGNALRDLSLTIKRGENIGIVGLSGSGKSTLFKLLLDLYENYEGDISLDEISFKQMNRQSYIDHVAVVLQDTELFNLSLRENITIAAVGNKPQLALSEVVRMAHLTDVVEQLPEKLQTVVGEKGIKLSGGQRQRVGIARSLYRQPEILLLDEATSHLDAYETMHRFTTIVIAHRLSTIKDMDRIVVIEKGRVKESGSFEQLLKKEGAFAKMWREQKL